MALTNGDDSYGLAAKFFHWSVAFLILGLLPMGLFMGGMENSPLKIELYGLHKSFGLLVLFLGLARIGWRFVSPAPEHLENHQPWERALAAASHGWLYICMIGMPLSGWVMSSALDFPVPFFGTHMPDIVAKNENIGALAGQAHEILAYTLLFVLGLHMAGALKHHVIDRDETLQRMSWRRAGIGLAALVVLAAGASYTVSGLSILKEMGRERGGEGEKTGARVTAGTLPDTSDLGEDGWAIVPAESRLSFRAALYGSEFEGVFNHFSGRIHFNPDALQEARADIVIDMKDVVTGDADRDYSIKGAEWFDSNQFGTATFESMAFEQAGDGTYLAVGNLTLRGVTLPVSLPFTLDIQGDRAVMKGSVVLNRLDFGMGTGEWADDKTVGHKVTVDVAVTAIR